MTSNINKPLTKKDVKEIIAESLLEFSDIILTGVQTMFDEQNKINEKRFAKESSLKNVETRLTHVEDDVKYIKDEIVFQLIL